VHGLLRVIVKEIRQLRRDRKMIPAMIVGPLIQLLALGFAANNDVNDVPLLLVDLDRSPPSARIVDRFTGSGYFRLVGAEDDLDRMDAWLVSGKAQIALVVGPGYGADLAAGRRPRIQVVADGTDSTSAVVGLGYAGRIVAELGAELMSAAGGPSTGRVVVAPRVWYNPDLKSRWFYLPAILALVLMLVTMILPSMAVVREKEVGTLEQLIVSPIRPWQLILGKLIPFFTVGVVDLGLVTALVVFVFGVPLRGSFALLVALTVLFLLNTLGLGLLVSSLARNQQQAMMSAVFLIMVPMIYLSGLIFPIENMPRAIQTVTYAIPLRYYANIIRGVFLKGSGIDALWPEALLLAGMGTLVLILASLRFRKNLD
jgi:ABC-2 type transport system permease protein